MTIGLHCQPTRSLNHVDVVLANLWRRASCGRTIVITELFSCVLPRHRIDTKARALPLELRKTISERSTANHCTIALNVIRQPG